MRIKVMFILTMVFLGDISKPKAQKVHKDRNPLLKKMTNAVKNNEYMGIHSILIAYGNRLNYEHYFNGFHHDSLHDSRSSFKSITSLLVGIAIDKGLIKNTNQKVYDFFPEYAPFKNNDPFKRIITIQNLLDMESGFDCEEFNDTKNCEDDMVTNNNWVKFSLDLPMKNQPGKVWAYTSCNPMILSGIISKAAHTSTMDFAKKTYLIH